MIPFASLKLYFFGKGVGGGVRGDIFWKIISHYAPEKVLWGGACTHIKHC